MSKNLLNESSSMFRDFESKLANLKKQIEDQIRNLPDNPRIKRLDERCYVVQFSDLGDSWSPFYHDYKAQYQKIIEILNATSLECCGKVLRDLLENKNKRKSRPVYTYFYKGHNIKFHPEVIKYVREALS